jgi:hypothetical protein
LEILKPATSKFAPGFRISLWDVVVLVIGISFFLALIKNYAPISLAIVFITGHFFLFCNVFRVARPLELLWAGIFIALSGCTIFCGIPGWPVTIAVSFGATIVVIVCEMRKPSYHGICWQQINPGLKNWWEANHSGKNLY